MATTELRIGVDALVLPALRNGTGENPVWDAPRACWWWIDIPRGAIHRWHPDSGALHDWALPHAIGNLVLCADGTLACAGVDTLAQIDPQPGQPLQPRVLATVPHPQGGMRCNDGRCDRQGRWWLSTMVGDIALGAPAGQWWRYTRAAGLQDGGHGGLVIPNGSAFSPDGRTRYSADTHRDIRQVWQQSYDPDTGETGPPRAFVNLRGTPGRPDGATVDADGCYWICCLDEGCIRRYTPDGRLDLRLVVPMAKPTMCAFGGADGRTLFVTSLSRGADDLAGDPHGGRVLLCRPGPQGLPEPRLAA